MRLHRLIGILLLVESRGTVKAKDVAQALEVSIRTIYRDIDTLCESGIPLRTLPGPNGGISFVEGYHVDFNHFYGDEVIQLYLTGMSIKPQESYEAKVKLQNTLLKLETNLPTEYQSDIERVKSRIYYDSTPWWGEDKTIPYLETLRKAVLQSVKINLTYVKYNEEVSTRTVLPYGLVAKQLDWYLVTYDESVKDYRTFKCERIKDVFLSDEKFEVDQDFSLEAYWKHAQYQFKKQRNKDEVYLVKLKLNKNDSFILRDLEIYESRQIEDYLIVVVNMYRFIFACTEALERIGFVEVIEPLELRDFIKESLKHNLEKYI